MLYTAHCQNSRGETQSVVRCASLHQLKEWCLFNGHVIVKGYSAQKAIRSGVCVRLLDSAGKVRF